MATGANRVPLGRLHPAMAKRKTEKESAGSSGLISQHMQRSQQGYQQHPSQPPLPQNTVPHQSYGNQSGNMYMQQPPLPPMPMQPPLPPSGNVYSAQPPPPPPPQPAAPQYDESHHQMLQYMQNIPKQRAAEKANDNPADQQPVKKKKRRSRWGDSEEKTKIPGMPVALPGHLTGEQQKQYLLHFKIEEISIKLRSGNLGIPSDPDDRSPSPEPIYNSEGKRLNTREFRVRKILEEERHSLIQTAYELNTEYKPPADYKPPSNKIQDKVMIPQDKNPTINFIGLLIGPRGNTLKKMEKDTNCKIIIRGKGSVKEGKGRPGGPLPGEDEPLHALVTGQSHADVKKAVDVITKIIKEGIECPESANELRRMQLRELAALNGTLIEEDMVRCRNCGSTDHRHWECTEQKNVTNMVVCTKCGGYGHVENDCVYQVEAGEVTQTFEEKVKMDEEYMSLMAELQGGDPAAAAAAAKNIAAAASKSMESSMPAANQSAVSAPWNAPMAPNSSSDPPSLLGKPPTNQAGGLLPMPTPVTPAVSSSVPQPLMPPGSGSSMGMSSQQPPWMTSTMHAPKPPAPTNFGSQSMPSSAARPPLPPMPAMMSMQGMTAVSRAAAPPPPPPAANGPPQPQSASNIVSSAQSSWDTATAPWQASPVPPMSQASTAQSYMLPGMAAYSLPPPPPPPPGASTAPLPPWANAPPPPPPPPSS